MSVEIVYPHCHSPVRDLGSVEKRNNTHRMPLGMREIEIWRTNIYLNQSSNAAYLRHAVCWGHLVSTEPKSLTGQKRANFFMQVPHFYTLS
jgi:hypothetical protein